MVSIWVRCQTDFFKFIFQKFLGVADAPQPDPPPPGSAVAEKWDEERLNIAVAHLAQAVVLLTPFFPETDL